MTVLLLFFFGVRKVRSDMVEAGDGDFLRSAGKKGKMKII